METELYLLEPWAVAPIALLSRLLFFGLWYHAGEEHVLLLPPAGHAFIRQGSGLFLP